MVKNRIKLWVVDESTGIEDEKAPRVTVRGKNPRGAIHRALKLGLNIDKGHIYGKEKIKELLEWCFELEIRNLTLYAFSIENFDRGKNEVLSLMNLCKEELNKALKDSRIHNNEVKINVIGNLESLPENIKKSAKFIMEKTKNYKKYLLNIALAYGGREEIIHAIKNIAKDMYHEFDLKFYVYKDLRNRGLIVTPGVKYGCDFAVYKIGPGIDHAPYMVSVYGLDTMVSATDLVKNGRLATTVRKRFIIAIPDLKENAIEYLIFKWFKA